MEYVLKAGRGLGSGVCRAASALARGTRRILAYVPLLGIAAVPVAAQDTKLPTVRHSGRLSSFPDQPDRFSEPVTSRAPSSPPPPSPGIN